MTTNSQAVATLRLKRFCGVTLNKIAKSINHDDVANGEQLDIEKLNSHPTVVKAKHDMAEKSIVLLGENIVSRKWLMDEGFIVAGMILTDKGFE
jgi:hypothetical protein